LSGKRCGSKWDCTILGLGNMASSSGDPSSTLHMCWAVASSMGPVDTSTLRMLVNQ